MPLHAILILSYYYANYISIYFVDAQNLVKKNNHTPIILYSIFVYTIDGTELYSIHKNRYNLFTHIHASMDGGDPWVITRYVRRTPTAISIMYVGGMSVRVIDIIPAAVSIITNHRLTKVRLGAIA